MGTTDVFLCFYEAKGEDPTHYSCDNSCAVISQFTIEHQRSATPSGIM